MKSAAQFAECATQGGNRRHCQHGHEQGEPDEGGFWATCLEVPGANGQGETRDECLGNLAEAVQLLLDTGREEAFRLDPQAETAELLLA
jgi:predicted RNase H-like HicB family nuclease